MITAIDTVVLLDVVAGGPFGRRSLEAIRAAIGFGRIVASEIVWAEFAAAYRSTPDAERALNTLAVEFDPIGREAAVTAGAAWRAYRARGGPRTRLIPDFLVGAHAGAQADQLLTRDRGFYRTYFQGLVIVDPSRV